MSLPVSASPSPAPVCLSFIMLPACRSLTLEGWSTIMYWYGDAISPIIAGVVFVSLTFVVSFFILQLVISAIFLSFTSAQLAETEALRIRKERVAAIARAEKAEQMIAVSKARLVTQVRMRGLEEKLALRRLLPAADRLGLSPAARDAAAASEAMRRIMDPEGGAPARLPREIELELRRLHDLDDGRAGDAALAEIAAAVAATTAATPIAELATSRSRNAAAMVTTISATSRFFTDGPTTTDAMPYMPTITDAAATPVAVSPGAGDGTVSPPRPESAEPAPNPVYPTAAGAGAVGAAGAGTAAVPGQRAGLGGTMRIRLPPEHGAGATLQQRGHGSPASPPRLATLPAAGAAAMRPTFAYAGGAIPSTAAPSATARAGASGAGAMPAASAPDHDDARSAMTGGTDGLTRLLGAGGGSRSTRGAGSVAGASEAGSGGLESVRDDDVGSVNSVSSLQSAVASAFARRFRLPSRTPFCSRLRYAALTLIASGGFSLVMTALIIVNIVTMSLDSYPNDIARAHSLEVVNAALTLAFAGEMVLRLGALGFRAYVRDRMNVFDAVVVISSLVDLGMSPPVRAQLSGSSATGSRTFKRVAE